LTQLNIFFLQNQAHFYIKSNASVICNIQDGVHFE